MLFRETMELPVQNINHSAFSLVAQWTALYDAHTEIACLMLGSMTPELHRQFELYYPYDMIQELRSMFSWSGEMKGYVEKLERLGYVLPQDISVCFILIGLTLKIMWDLYRNYNYANMGGRTIGEIYAMLLSMKRDERKLKQGALYLYVGNGVRAQVEAIGSFDLFQGLVFFYFNAVPRNGIYEIDMHDLVPNVNSIYNVSNKRVKHNLDSTYLWHCRLAHINKKRIKQLQQDGLLKSTDDESFDKCESCLSGKMTKKPFLHSNERAKDLLGIIHTDTIKAIRSDRGGEYISQEFKDYLKANGIVQQLTPPYTPQHNGVSERRNRTLLDMVRSMMNLTTLPLSFWDYALESATRILNMVPTKKVDKTPYELWYGKVPNLSYLKVWGCEALVKRDTPDKLEQRSVKCIFIGYPKETMGYYFYFPPENKIVVARYAEFFEKRLISQEISEVEGFELPQEAGVIPIRKESNKWIDAMNAEIQSMMDNMVWVLVDLPPGCKTVGSRWLFKKKTDMDGIVHVYKARLVAKGYTQLYGVDYEETFSPVADIRAIRILISIAAYYDYEIWQMDVKTAFLNGYLDEDIYMVQPEGFVDPNHPRKVCKLQRSIYGLKQASRSWNKRFDEEIKRFGFTQNLDEPCVYQKASGSNVTFLILKVCKLQRSIYGLKQASRSWNKRFDKEIKRFGFDQNLDEPCVYQKASGSNVTFLILYVDDIIIMGEAAFILGIKIYRDRSKRLIRLSQNAYMNKILKRYKMDNSKRGTIPMQERLDLNKSQGSIMYTVRCTRPDVAFTQNLTSRFQQNPGELHWTDVKNILKYLRNTKDMFLVYDGNPEAKLRVYCYYNTGF
ncbi:retrotransposon protein, putative, ty1-copia subclass [Tanacetum coccineum]